MSKKAIGLYVLIGCFAASLWTNRQFMTVAIHALRLKKDSEILFGESQLSPQRIHQFFLSEGIYIPKEDIFTQEAMADFLDVRKACSKGNIHVWVPLKLRIPIFGEKVIEWCMSLP